MSWTFATRGSACGTSRWACATPDVVARIPPSGQGSERAIPFSCASTTVCTRSRTPSFAIARGHVGLDGGLTEKQGAGDLLVGQAARQQPEDVELTSSEPVDDLRLAWAARRMVSRLARTCERPAPPGTPRRAARGACRRGGRGAGVSRSLAPAGGDVGDRPGGEPVEQGGLADPRPRPNEDQPPVAPPRRRPGIRSRHAAARRARGAPSLDARGAPPPPLRAAGRRGPAPRRGSPRPRPPGGAPSA